MLADMDIADRREVTVLGKGRKERSLPIGANAARAMGRYHRMRRSHRTTTSRRSGSASGDR